MRTIEENVDAVINASFNEVPTSELTQESVVFALWGCLDRLYCFVSSCLWRIKIFCNTLLKSYSAI